MNCKTASILAKVCLLLACTVLCSCRNKSPEATSISISDALDILSKKYTDLICVYEREFSINHDETIFWNVSGVVLEAATLEQALVSLGEAIRATSKFDVDSGVDFIAVFPRRSSSHGSTPSLNLEIRPFEVHELALNDVVGMLNRSIGRTAFSWHSPDFPNSHLERKLTLKFEPGRAMTAIVKIAKAVQSERVDIVPWTQHSAGLEFPSIVYFSNRLGRYYGSAAN
jgi:hypothetical protein